MRSHSYLSSFGEWESFEKVGRREEEYESEVERSEKKIGRLTKGRGRGNGGR